MSSPSPKKVVPKKPKSSSTPPEEDSYTDQVTRILHKYDPKMEKMAGKMLEKFVGKEQALIQSLLKKHGASEVPPREEGSSSASSSPKPSGKPVPKRPSPKPQTTTATPNKTPDAEAAAATPTKTATTSSKSPTTKPIVTAAAAGSSSGSDTPDEQCRRILTKHDTKMLPVYAKMIAPGGKFEGKETTLLNMYIKKYGEVPSKEEVPLENNNNKNESPKPKPVAKKPARSPSSAAAASSSSTPPESSTIPSITGDPVKDETRAILKEHDPGMLPKVGAMEKKMGPDQLLTMLRKKFTQGKPYGGTSTTTTSSSSSKGQIITQEPNHKERLLRWYAVYDPPKVKDADAILAERKGSEDEIWPLLLKKYGKEPPPGDDQKSRLERFYMHHKRLDKLADVDAIVQERAGSYDAMWQQLTKAYGPEPKLLMKQTPKSTPTPTPKSTPPAETAAKTTSKTTSPRPHSSSVRQQKTSTPPPQAAAAATPTATSAHATPSSTSIQHQDQQQPQSQSDQEEEAATITKIPDHQLPQDNSHRSRLVRFYNHYDPGKMDEVDKFVAKFQGREDGMWKYLTSRPHYGPEPPFPSSSSSSSPATASSFASTSILPNAASQQQQNIGGTSSSTHRQRLIRFYVHYGLTDKLPLVDANLSKYTGKEDIEMWPQLSAKYGSEPAITAATPLIDRAIAMYLHYDPQECKNISTHMKTFKGQEEEWIQALIKKYGVEPPTSKKTSSSFFNNNQQQLEQEQEQYEKKEYEGLTDTQIRIHQMYEKYDTKMLNGFYQQLELYSGREDDLLRSLIKKYGPEPFPRKWGEDSYQQQRRSATATATASTTLSPETAMHRRITNMLERYDREELSNLPVLLERYKGKEEELLKSMVTRYGPEPPLRQMQDREVLQERASNMIKHYDPDAVDSLPELLQRFSGREDKLLRTLQRKFGPEPLESLGVNIAKEAAIPPTVGENITEIRQIITEHEPDSAAAIPGLLNRYHGKEETLLALLRQRYGTTIHVGLYDPSSLDANQKEAEDPRLKGSVASYEARIRNLLAKYEPESVDNVEVLLEEENKKMKLSGASASGGGDNNVEGQEDDEIAEKLLNDLIAKHGPEPPMLPVDYASSSSSPSRNQSASQQQKAKSLIDENDPTAIARQKLTALFTHYDRMQLPRVDEWLDRYNGREEEMLIAAHKKFAVPPPKPKPDWLKPMQRLCIAMGMDELYLERLVNAMGSSATRDNVMFELLLTWFPDFVMSLMTDEGQRRCLVSKRLSRFLSVMAPNRVKEIPELLRQIPQDQNSEVALGDLLLTFFSGPVQSAAIPRLDHSSLREQSEIIAAQQAANKKSDQSQQGSGNVGAGFIGNVEQLQRLLEMWHLQRHHTRTLPRFGGDSATDLIRFPRIVHRAAGPDELIDKPVRTTGTDTETDEASVFGSSTPAGGKTIGAIGGTSSPSRNLNDQQQQNLQNNYNNNENANQDSESGSAVAANPLLFSRFGVDSNPVPRGRWGCDGCQQLREYATASDQKWQHQLREQELKLWRLMEGSNIATREKEKAIAFKKDHNTSAAAATSGGTTLEDGSCSNCEKLTKDIEQLRHRVHYLTTNIDARAAFIQSQQQQQQQDKDNTSTSSAVTATTTTATPRMLFQREYPAPDLSQSMYNQTPRFYASSAGTNNSTSSQSSSLSAISPAIQRSSELWSSLYYPSSGGQQQAATGYTVPTSANAKKVLNLL